MSGLQQRLRRILGRDRQAGQGMVEYGLILVLIAVIVIVSLVILGNQVVNEFSDITSGLGT
ncbi:MAG: Flp family type IVb pilin [Candidatus Dormibacteraeota bacterium]|nr:Flp family type IVb pilin [Candidatus Dormibacteraeota bacterium]